MNDQILKLGWPRPMLMPSPLSRVAQEVIDSFADFLSALFPSEKAKTQVEQMARVAYEESPIRMVPLPVGYRNRACPMCGSDSLVGSLASIDSDEADPDVLCRSCLWVN
jgi:hypothetical protein